MGGIQHIICSATMTIDGKGRVTPRQQKKAKALKKKGIEAASLQSTMEALCTTLKFRSKNPKIIDLTEQIDASGKSMMPETLSE